MIKWLAGKLAERERRKYREMLTALEKLEYREERRFGLDIQREMERLGSKPSGSFYVRMSQLEKDGMVTSEKVEDPHDRTRNGLPRRRYELTEQGRKWLKEID